MKKVYKQQIEELNKKLDLAKPNEMLKTLNSYMTHKSIKIFVTEIYSKPPKKNYSTNKTHVYHYEDICSLDILDLKDYGAENNKNYRYVLVVIDNFSKYGWTTPLKNKNSETIKNFFEKFLISSKRKSKLTETDRGREFYNIIFQNFLNNNNIKHYSSITPLSAVLAKRLNLTIRKLLKRPVFERGDGKWIDVLPTITKQYFNRVHSSTKLTLIQDSLKKKEGFAYNNSLDKRKKINTKIQVNDLVRTADLKRTFSISDTNN